MKVDDPGLADRPAATRPCTRLKQKHTQHPPRVRVADGAWVSGTDRGAGAGTARMRICALAPSGTLGVDCCTSGSRRGCNGDGGALASAGQLDYHR